MRKLIILTSLFFIGCTPNKPTEIVTVQNDTFLLVEKHSEDFTSEFKTIIIDSCEYLVMNHGPYLDMLQSITHKGNCKNH